MFTLTVCLHHIIGHCLETNSPGFQLLQDNCITGLVSFIHSLIHSSFGTFIHSAVCCPSLPAVIYSVELERQAAEYWVISAFLSRHSMPHESLQLKEKRSQGSICIHVPVSVVYILYVYAGATIIFVMLLAVHNSERTSLNIVISISTLTRCIVYQEAHPYGSHITRNYIIFCR